MRTRVLVGLGALAVFLPLVVWGGQAVFEGIVVLALVVGLVEWADMAVPGLGWGGRLAVLLAGLGVFGAALHAGGAAGVLAAAFALMGVALVALFGVRDTARAADAAARMGMGALYLGLGTAFAVEVRRLGLPWLFVVLGAAWMGDTGAYFAGRAYGRRRLFERVSPKKTWEGFFGGLVASVAWTAGVAAVAIPELSAAEAVAVGALLDVAGVLGDLVESMFKRAFGVKDSGRIMPGHGGILDRIDSVLFIAPLCWALAELLAG